MLITTLLFEMYLFHYKYIVLIPFTSWMHVRKMKLREQGVYYFEDNSKDNNITIDPNTSGYIDRKMDKWQGLILSEHIEKVIESEKVSKKILYRKKNNFLKIYMN